MRDGRWAYIGLNCKDQMMPGQDVGFEYIEVESVKIDKSDAAFVAWKSQLQALVEKHFGMSCDDMPDVSYRDWFELGDSPIQAFNRAKEEWQT